MTMKHAGFAAGAVVLTLVLACITVNIYFPEATVKKAADEIVDEIRKKDTTEKKAPETIKQEAVMSRSGGFTFVPAAFAQQETTVSNPAIRALKDSMKQRFPSLKPYYDGGNLGEANTGFVEVRSEDGLDLKAKATMRGLVRDENGDRTKLYAEVAKALNIQASQVSRIQKIFAASWINNASSGWWVQNDAGDWAKK